MPRFVIVRNDVINLDAITRINLDEKKGKARLTISYGVGNFVRMWGAPAKIWWEKLRTELNPQAWDIPLTEDPPEGEAA